jgi:flagellar biosynthesis GTPase FlhF
MKPKIFLLILALAHSSSAKSQLEINCIPEQSTCRLENFSNTPACYRDIFKLIDTQHAKAKTLIIAKSKLATFPHILSRVFKDLASLHIDNCGLQKLTGNDIAGFENLVEITAANNEIKRINEDIFDHCKKVAKLDLRNNRIREIDIGSLLMNKKLKSLKLQGNACINKNILFGNEVEVAMASKEIIERCHPTAFKPDMSKRRCLITMWLLGEYQERQERKERKAREKREHEEWERRQREERERKQREEAARWQQQETVRRQQEEAARWQQQEAARKQQEEATRRQQEAAAKLQRENTEKQNRLLLQQQNLANEKKTKEFLEKFESDLRVKLEREIFSKITAEASLQEKITSQIMAAERQRCSQIKSCGNGGEMVTFNAVDFARILECEFGVFFFEVFK